MPGIVKILETLREEKKRIGVFSGNSREIGEIILKKTGLKDYFEETFFSTDSTGIVEKKSLLEFALKKLQMPANRIVVVADTTQDAMAAQQLGMGFFGVATGLHSLEELEKVATKVFENAEEILKQ